MLNKMFPPADNFNGVFKGLRVLITGHTGFKGSWLSLWLETLGARVGGLSLPPPTKPSLFEVLGLEKQLDYSEVGDIRDYAKVKEVMVNFKPELIFHLAAQPLVRLSYARPRETYETNVQGTLNVLEAARHCDSVRALVCITTDKCYENKETLSPYKESDPLGGYDMYSSSKGCAEILCASFRRSFLLPESSQTHKYLLATARAGNVIGGGDWAEDRLIPDCARALSEGKPIVLRNPKSIRPWQHVLEPLSGYLMLGARLLSDSFDYTKEELTKPDTLAFNFGPAREDVLTVEQMAKLFISSWGAGDIRVEKNTAAVHEAGLLTLNNEKAKNILHWQPTWNAEQAVRESAKWYQKFYGQGTDLREQTLGQIKLFSHAFQ